MDFIEKNIHEYAEAHSNVFSEEVLQEIERHTHLKEMMPQMLSGYLQGQFLAFVSQMIAPRRILEIGTFTGYSAICLAQGLSEDGQLHTLEVNEELESTLLNFFQKAGLDHKIQLMIGHAMDTIDSLTDSYDLVFIDADKINYPNYYDKVFSKVNVGGYFLVDNVLWSGKVTKQPIKDKKTAAIHQLNEKIQKDDRVSNVLLPLRDGMMLARKLRD